MRVWAVAILCAAATAGAVRILTAQAPQVWVVQNSGITTNLRSVSAVYASVADKTPVLWASGSNGVILRSLDGGATWQQLRVEGGQPFDFRGIHAFDANLAYLMSSGKGENSRIYRTKDGGQTWWLAYNGAGPDSFLDGIVCASESNCYVLNDPVDGKFLLISTQDGEAWRPLPRNYMPPALPGEGAFAASNSSLVLSGNDLYFGTGGGAVARVFHSIDGGVAWAASEVPVAAGNASSGVFSIAPGEKYLVAVGGDYRQTGLAARTAALSFDAGVTWRLAGSQLSGYRSAVARLDSVTLLAVGPNGTDISRDGGESWVRVDSLSLNALAVLDDGHVWAVGPNGTVARYVRQGSSPNP